MLLGGDGAFPFFRKTDGVAIGLLLLVLGGDGALRFFRDGGLGGTSRFLDYVPADVTLSVPVISG